MYIVDALAAIGSDAEATLTALMERYASLESTSLPPTADGSYAEVDEKIAIAAALYALVSDDRRAEYLTFVTDWLRPPPPGLTDSLLEGYWERRWMAVVSLERMCGAVEAVPLLESLRSEPGRKAWVDVQVPRVLMALREDHPR